MKELRKLCVRALSKKDAEREQEVAYNKLKELLWEKFRKEALEDDAFAE